MDKDTIEKSAGIAMGIAALAWWQTNSKTRLTASSAMAVIDRICEPYRGQRVDFESIDPFDMTMLHPQFDDFTDPWGSLGKLIAIAFEATPDEMHLATEHQTMPWLSGPCKRFRSRYQFT